MRLCTVLKGTVEVKMDDGADMALVRWNTFRIKSGSSCELKNLRLSEAVVHCVIIGERLPSP